MLVERAARAFVGPDVAVDGLVADAERAFEPQPARDLLGAPIFTQQRVDPRQQFPHAEWLGHIIIRAEIQAGLQFALAAPYPDPSEVTEDVYA